MINYNEIQRGDTFVWVSPKDGWFYKIKVINSNDKQIVFMILEVLKKGYITKIQYETVGKPKLISFTNENTPYKFLNTIDKNLDNLLSEYIINMINKEAQIDLTQRLSMCNELRGILERHPDKYIKFMTKILNNKYFIGLLENKYSL